MIEKFKQFKLDVENLFAPYQNKIAEIEADNNKLNKEKNETLKKAEVLMSELSFSEAKKLMTKAEQITEKINGNLADIKYFENILKNGTEEINKRKLELQKDYDKLRIYFVNKKGECYKKLGEVIEQMENEKANKLNEVNKEYAETMNAAYELTNIINQYIH